MKITNSYEALVRIAGISAAASLLSIIVPVLKFYTISTGGMFAIALMAFAPAVMGIGVSYLVTRLDRTSASEPALPALQPAPLAA